MNRRQILAGLIAAPAIIKVAGIMQIKPFACFTYDDFDFVFDNGLDGAIRFIPITVLVTKPPHAECGVLWNDNGTIRLSQ